LTVKQRRFVEAYMGDAQGNGTQAAALAGYRGNRNTLSSIADENLRKTEIANAIHETREVETDLAIMTRGERLALLSKMASDPKVRTSDRLRAIELLCKMNGDFTEKRIVERKRAEADGFAAQREELRALLEDPEARAAMEILVARCPVSPPH